MIYGNTGTRPWIAGIVPPADVTGLDQDFYMDIVVRAWWGPKTNGTWAGTGPNLMAGPPGANGLTILNGLVDPVAQGVNGDFYLNTATNKIFGPKAAGVWPVGVSLVGPPGANGLTILNGVVDPVAQGVNGDFYINTATNKIFGPKAAGAWPAGVSLVGPPGPAGGYTGVVTQITQVNCPYTVQPADQIIQVDLTGAALATYNVILPSRAASVGRNIQFVRIDNNMDATGQISASGADTIDYFGQTTANLSTRNSKRLQANTVVWFQPF